MDKEKINRIHTISLLVLGILSILLGLFYDSVPHPLRMAAAIVQILVGCGVIYLSILKIKGKF